MTRKEKNIAIIEKMHNRFQIDKTYLIELAFRHLSYKISSNTLNRCIKKYDNYALFEVLDNKGNKLYNTTYAYIDDDYTIREIKGN